MKTFRCGHERDDANTKTLKHNEGTRETCLCCFRAGQNRYRKKKYREDAAAMGRTTIRAYGCGDRVIIAALKSGLSDVDGAATLSEARRLARGALTKAESIEARRREN